MTLTELNAIAAPATTGLSAPNAARRNAHQVIDKCPEKILLYFAGSVTRYIDSVRHQFRRATHQRDAGGMHRHIGPGCHRHTDIGCGSAGRIVDAVIPTIATILPVLRQLVVILAALSSVV